MQKIYCTTSPGLEHLLAREFLSLRIPGSWECFRGGVELDGPIQSVYSIILKSRIVESVRMRIGNRFHAENENELVDGLRQLNWKPYLRYNRDLEISVVSDKSRLYHTKLIEERIRRVLDERRAEFINSRADSEILEHDQKKQPSKLHALMRNDKMQISVELASLLHRRRYRTAVGFAPLRETLAAASVLKTPFLQLLEEYGKRNEKLYVIDPFCGSGTILLEALAICLNLPSGNPQIEYPFKSIPLYQEKDFRNFVDDEIVPTVEPNEFAGNCEFLGSDSDALMISSAKKNLTRFLKRLPRKVLDLENLEEDLTNVQLPSAISFLNLHTREVERIIREKRNVLMITNVPYGKRCHPQSLNRVYDDLRQLVTSRKMWAGIYVISASEKFKERTKLGWRPELRFSNGVMVKRRVELKQKKEKFVEPKEASVKMVDSLILSAFAVFFTQILYYIVIRTTFPLNSLLSGLFSSGGTAIAAGVLRIQLTQQEVFKITPERALCDFLLLCLVLQLACMNFIG